MEAVIRIKGGLPVKHAALLLLAGVSPSAFFIASWQIAPVLENLIGISREQVWFVIWFITSIAFLILDIRMLYRKTPEFFY
jgi:hypothetical protein